MLESCLQFQHNTLLERKKERTMIGIRNMSFQGLRKMYQPFNRYIVQIPLDQSNSILQNVSVLYRVCTLVIQILLSCYNVTLLDAQFLKTYIHTQIKATHPFVISKTSY